MHEVDPKSLKCTKRVNSLQFARGFTLLESLIALVVLSIGLLGMASLQVKGLRTMQMGKFRTQASYLAYEMSDRIRANAAAVTVGAYDGEPEVSLVDCTDVLTLCTPVELAAFDKNQWLENLQVLPLGQGDLTAVGTDRVNITVRWDEERRGATGLNCPPQSDNDLRCYVLGVTL